MSGRDAESDQDVAPGVSDSAGESPRDALVGYTIGLGLATLLTVASFVAAGTHLIYGPSVPVALAVLAIAQIGVHLVFFLHITTGPDNTNNVLALAFGILVVFLIGAGSLWIMDHLSQNMMPMQEMMEMQR